MSLDSGNKKFHIFFDYRKAQGKTRSATRRAAGGADTNSIELGPWLDTFANKEKIYDYRLFYVLKPNAEDVVKFGIAGTKGEHGGWGRLHQYINEYGYSSDLNRCTGIQMLYLAGNKYSKTVEIVKSDVFKKELACKQYFRAPEVKAHLLGRGYERINLDRIAELFQIIDDPSNKNFGDVETERRVQQQRGQQKLQDTDKILRITGHVTLGGKSKARTKFKCYWNRPAILTKEKMLKKKAVNPKKDSDLRDLERDQARFETEETERTEDHETWQFYTEIISMNGGSDAMSVYEELHPKAAAKFRK